MDSTIIVALISCIGTLLGSLLGIVTTSKLTQYRLEQLEAKVDKHNNVIERMTKAEGSIVELQHEVQDLKKYHAP